MSVKSEILSQIRILHILIGKGKSPIREIIPTFPLIIAIGLSVIANYQSSGVAGKGISGGVIGRGMSGGVKGGWSNQ